MLHFWSQNVQVNPPEMQHLRFFSHQKSTGESTGEHVCRWPYHHPRSSKVRWSHLLPSASWWPHVTMDPPNLGSHGLQRRFQRFPGLGLELPEVHTAWLWRARFQCFDEEIHRKNTIPGISTLCELVKGGPLIDDLPKKQQLIFYIL